MSDDLLGQLTAAEERYMLDNDGDRASVMAHARETIMRLERERDAEIEATKATEALRVMEYERAEQAEANLVSARHGWKDAALALEKAERERDEARAVARDLIEYIKGMNCNEKAAMAEKALEAGDE